MSDVPNATAKGRPWHLWVVGILMVLWNSIGCIDFVMTQSKFERNHYHNITTDRNLDLCLRKLSIYLSIYPTGHYLI